MIGFAWVSPRLSAPLPSRGPKGRPLKVLCVILTAPWREVCPRSPCPSMATTLTLTKKLAPAIRAGHPWIYADALARPPPLPAAAVVDIADPAGRFVARGRYDPASPIAVRVWTLEQAEPLDDALVSRRVGAALALRQ